MSEKFSKNKQTRYKLILNLHVYAGSAPDFKFIFTAPTGTIGSYFAQTFIQGIITGATIGDILVTQEISTDGHLRLKLEGIIETGNVGGTVKFQFAQKTSSVNAVIVKENSFMTITKI